MCRRGTSGVHSSAWSSAAAAEGETTTNNEDDVTSSSYVKNPGDAAVENDYLLDQKQQQPIIGATTPAFVFDTLEATIKYQSYIRRQNKDMESWRKAQGLRIPPDVIYSREYLPTLSSEELEKLQTIRPKTFADASQISGLTPNSLVYLYHHVNRRSKKRDELRGNTVSAV